MKKYFFIALVTLLQVTAICGQNPLKSPAEFLGYPLGETFTHHHLTVAYFKEIAEASPLVKYQSYGNTYEGRELGLVFVSSPENLQNLETLRTNNLKHTGLMEGPPGEDQKPIVWLSYNLHGNEAVGMEAAMKVLYALVTDGFDGAEAWLRECIVVIDPCLNPDGRDRYTANYRMRQSVITSVSTDSWERVQPWPGSRSNHYFLDLNRDWTWQTQIETRQRLALYQEYMPHVHADFHEMGINSTYFFPPGADPWHDAITPWQRTFHQLTGQANAALFDRDFLLYYTAESFDLFSPSYGDTWPLFNGAMGFTYEQAGSGGAGVAVERSFGDTLTLKDRIRGHYLSSMATIQAAFQHREALLDGFNAYFEQAATNPPFEYGSILVKASNDAASLESFLELLDNNLIRYGYAARPGQTQRGFDYKGGSTGSVVLEKNDILIPAAQPQGHLVKVLFEPQSLASDSLTYDLTAWGLPYVYNLKSYALSVAPEMVWEKTTEDHQGVFVGESLPYAYLANWTGFRETQFLAALFRKNINVRSVEQAIAAAGETFNPGSLIIARGDNNISGQDFDQTVTTIANQHGITLVATYTGVSTDGPDFGSGSVRFHRPPSIATIGGEGTSAGSLGEMRFFFEQELGYPLTIIDAGRFSAISLNSYDVLILTSGNHQRFKEPIMEFVRGGGKVLALEGATGLFASDESTGLGRATRQKNSASENQNERMAHNDTSLLVPYDQIRRQNISSRSANAIYMVSLDTTHPYTFGLGETWFVMKRSSGLPFLSSGNNIGYVMDAAPVSGFAGYKFREQVKNTLVVGSERLGRGEVIYVADNPYFRAYWKSGRVLLGNILLK